MELNRTRWGDVLSQDNDVNTVCLSHFCLTSKENCISLSALIKSSYFKHLLDGFSVGIGLSDVYEFFRDLFFEWFPVDRFILEGHIFFCKIYGFI